jgi:lysylphosphatidylglycerol synthetase-like protein (DUF2156 family)
VILILPILFIALAIPALCIWAAVDAASQPEWAFEAAGTSKTLWIVLPIAGFFVCLVGVVAAIMWFTTYKPRVENAARGGSGYPPPVV